MEVPLPDNWSVQQVATSSLRGAPPDWPDRLAMSLNQPSSGIGLAKLLEARPNGRIVIIVEDMTRHSPTPEILQVLLREIRHNRTENSQIEIFFATGMHSPVTAQQVEAKLGPAADGIAWRCNPWADRSAYVCVGKTNGFDVFIDRGVVSADLRIIVSSVSPHMQAGFGGGYKMILPGCAHLDTIRGLHRLGLGRKARQLAGMEGIDNPMRRAIDAGGQLMDGVNGTSFAVQYLLDEQDLPSSVACGQAIPTQRMVAKQCAVACGVVIPQPSDVLITNAHPRDYDLWQSFKCIANTLWAVRPGGVIICLSQCPAGTNGMRIPRWPISPGMTRRIIRMIGAEGLYSMLTRFVPSLAGDAAFFVRIALQTVQRNTILLVSPTLYSQGVKFPAIEVFETVQDAIAASQAIFGKGPQRAVVFPSGGITFPVVTSGLGTKA